MLNYLAVFEDVACTSKPQTWHKPCDDKIKSLEIQSLQVGSYKKHEVMTESKKDMSSKFLKGESFRPGTKISSNYKDHTFEVFIYKYQQTPQLTGI